MRRTLLSWHAVSSLARVSVLALALAACSGSEPTGETLAHIRERGEITWGADVQGGEPYVYEDPMNPSGNKIGFEDWMRMDLRYIDTWSLSQDLKLIALTVPVAAVGYGAS